MLPERGLEDKPMELELSRRGGHVLFVVFASCSTLLGTINDEYMQFIRNKYRKQY